MRKFILFVFSIICILTIICFVCFNFVLYPTRFENFVSEYSSEFCLEQALVYSIIKTESDFDSGAVSKTGAVGLMQIMPATAKWIAERLEETFNEKALFDPQTNIKYGCFYLNYLFAKFKNQDVVICAYNAGETVVKKWLNEVGEIDEQKIEYEETRNYLAKVKKCYKFYKFNLVCN